MDEKPNYKSKKNYPTLFINNFLLFFIYERKKKLKERKKLICFSEASSSLIMVLNKLDIIKMKIIFFAFKFVCLFVHLFQVIQCVAFDALDTL